MSEILATMYTFFQDSKTDGSYFLMFALSIFILYSINRGKNRWFMWYPILLILIVVGNPLSVWALSKIFPVVASYEPITALLPILVYVPFAIAELISGLKTVKERHIVAIVLFLFVSISGNLFGVFGGDTMTPANSYDDEKEMIVNYCNENTDRMVVADENIVPFLSAYGDNIPLLYGIDMWTDGMDLGIMDSYDEGQINLWQHTWDPAGNIDLIASEAEEYNCDIIILDKYDDAKAAVGAYSLALETDNYLIYEMQ